MSDQTPNQELFTWNEAVELLQKSNRADIWFFANDPHRNKNLMDLAQSGLNKIIGQGYYTKEQLKESLNDLLKDAPASYGEKRIGPIQASGFREQRHKKLEAVEIPGGDGFYELLLKEGRKKREREGEEEVAAKLKRLEELEKKLDYLYCNQYRCVGHISDGEVKKK